MPRSAWTPEKLLATPVASTMKSTVTAIGPSIAKRAPGEPGAPPLERRLLTGAVEDLVVFVEVLGSDHRGGERRQIGDGFPLGQRGEKLGRLGALLVERLGDDAVGTAGLYDVE